MSPIRMYRAMTCNTRVRVALSLDGGLVFNRRRGRAGLTIERQPASAWDLLVWFSAGGFLLSAAGILIGAGSLIQTVKAFGNPAG